MDDAAVKYMNRVSTGRPGLDKVIDHLRIGDNVVWQVDDIRDYHSVANAFADAALAQGRKVVYLRFAQHEPLLGPGENLTIIELDAGLGFETFSTQIHTIITDQGEQVFYVFDSLSDLLHNWATDLMIGNFFFITCPYLFELKTVAYFALLRQSHSYATIARIRETTQVLIDTYNCEGGFYVQPHKVWKRYSPTMFLPHMQKGGEYLPVTTSVDASKLFAHMSRFTESAQRNLDYWDRLFLKAEDLFSMGADEDLRQHIVEQLCDIMITREPKMSDLVKRHLDVEDMLDIKARMIGSGFIGGKSVGMLLARKILSKDISMDWSSLLETHDSFYIGSDVFYTYLVNNGCWKLRMEQKTRQGYFTVAGTLRERLLEGIFSDEIKEHFLQLIEYFGQSPIIVRSSSLLEDSFGNAFAGKYESIFLANQGSPEQRYARFEDAVRRIYASTMNEDALIYRRKRGLEDKDEQMALLVQRVSGAYRKHYFFPDVGGVGVSHNTFVWKKGMDSRSGMLRIVFGLGTRAVDRVEGDYPRLVALDEPLSRPFAGMDDLRTFSQHKADVINMQDNDLQTMDVSDLIRQDLDVPLPRIAVPDEESIRIMRELGKKGRMFWLITFDNFLSGSRFAGNMHSMLKTLEKEYGYPVDIEFTLNFTGDDSFRINLVQCRPLQTLGEERPVMFPDHVEEEKTFIRMEGNFMGGNITQSIGSIVYIEPREYMGLSLQDKYEVARIVGEINRTIASKDDAPAMLLGPGRWGTTTPNLGVPVHFAEISNYAVLGEVALVEGNLMPELSYGTHFFQDLVENRIFFLAVFPGRPGVVFNTDMLKGLPNALKGIVPEQAGFEHVIKVFDVTGLNVKLIADVVSQRLLCCAEGRYEL